MSSTDASVLPNVDCSVNRKQQVYVLHILLPVLSGLFLATRFYIRQFKTRNVGWDDGFVLAGWCFGTATDILAIEQTKYWLGQQITCLEDFSLLTGFFKLMYFAPLLYITAALFIKNGVLLFYLRLSREGKVRTATWILFVMNFAIWIACGIPGTIGCWPVSFFWNKEQSGKCIDLAILYYANASLNIIMDVSTVLLPFPLIITSQSLSFWKKVRVMSLLCVGIFVCIASGMRIPQLHGIFGDLMVANVTWRTVDSHAWSQVECHLAIMASCVPAIAVLFRSENKAQKYYDYSYGQKNSGNSNRSGQSKKSIPKADESILMETTIEVENHPVEQFNRQ